MVQSTEFLAAVLMDGLACDVVLDFLLGVIHHMQFVFYLSFLWLYLLGEEICEELPNDVDICIGFD